MTAEHSEMMRAADERLLTATQEHNAAMRSYMAALAEAAHDEAKRTTDDWSALVARLRTEYRLAELYQTAQTAANAAWEVARDEWRAPRLVTESEAH